jgi:hypothetical protein
MGERDLLKRGWEIAWPLLPPTIALTVALAIAPERAELEAHVWLVVVLGFALVLLRRSVRSTYPPAASPFLRSLDGPRARIERPASLLRVEREVSMARASAFDVHFRLRPTVWNLATELLAFRRGIDLNRDPEPSQAVLGDDLWELVRPDRPQPPQRDAPGIDVERLERVVTALERI